MLNFQSGIHAEFSDGVTEVGSDEVEAFFLHQDWDKSSKVV